MCVCRGGGVPRWFRLCEQLSPLSRYDLGVWGEGVGSDGRGGGVRVQRSPLSRDDILGGRGGVEVSLVVHTVVSWE